MAEDVSATKRFFISARAILWFSLLLLALLGAAVVKALPWWLILAVVLIGLLLGALPFLVLWLLNRSDPYWSGKGAFLRCALGGVLLAVGLAGLPVYYAAYWVDSGPTSIPLATLSNGKKTVVFQGMQHIGSEGFYKGVVFDLEKALTDGYTLFYEGVQDAPGRKDVDDWFYKDFMGVKTSLSASYQQLADQCGMTFQLNYFEPLMKDKAIHPSKHVVADVSTLDLRQEFDRLMREDAAFAAYVNQQRTTKQDQVDFDPVTTALTWVVSATSAQKRLVGFVCRGVLAMTMNSDITHTTPKEKLIILYRNRALARMVAESKAEKIYITYGAKHFLGFIGDLKALDPAFEIKSLSWSKAMSSPRDANPPEDLVQELRKR